MTLFILHLVAIVENLGAFTGYKFTPEVTCYCALYLSCKHSNTD